MNRSLLACALLAGCIPAAAPGTAAAQTDSAATPDSVARTAADGSVSAEHWFRAGTWMFTAEIGGAAFSDFQRARARPSLATHELPEFQRRISARTSVAIGARASYWLGRSWGIRAGGSYVPTRFSVFNEESAQRMLDKDGVGDEQDTAASLGVWLADLAIVFRFPHSFGRVVPYGIAGAGLAHYSAGAGEDLPPEARRGFARGSRTTPAAVFGAGAVIPLERHDLLLTFELTNHLAATPLDDEGAGEPFELSGVPMKIEHTVNDAGSDGVGVTSNLRLSLGLTLPVRF